LRRRRQTRSSRSGLRRDRGVAAGVGRAWSVVASSAPSRRIPEVASGPGPRLIRRRSSWTRVCADEPRAPEEITAQPELERFPSQSSNTLPSQSSNRCSSLSGPELEPSSNRFPNPSSMTLRRLVAPSARSTDELFDADRPFLGCVGRPKQRSAARRPERRGQPHMPRNDRFE